MSDEPWIDFDGDGVGDDYETVTHDDGSATYTQYNEDGEVAAVAHDFDGDGLIDALEVDSDGDGTLDAIQFDEDGDGFMDTEIAYSEEDVATDEGAPAEDDASAYPEGNPSGAGLIGGSMFDLSPGDGQSRSDNTLNPFD